MPETPTSIWEEFASPAQRNELRRLALRRRWHLALPLVGWLHLAAFSLCYYLTVSVRYHEAAGYLAAWVGELCGVALIFRLCRGSRTADATPPLGRFVVRVWVAYFVLAFNLCTLNGL